MWCCKLCSLSVSKRYQILKHLRLKHSILGLRRSYPCIYSHCLCTFKTWGGLRTHLSRAHVAKPSHTVEHVILTCPSCSESHISTSRECFLHINKHLKRFETVDCVYQNCSFKTNVYGTFQTQE